MLPETFLLTFVTAIKMYYFLLLVTEKNEKEEPESY